MATTSLYNPLGTGQQFNDAQIKNALKNIYGAANDEALETQLKGVTDYQELARRVLGNLGYGSVGAGTINTLASVLGAGADAGGYRNAVSAMTGTPMVDGPAQWGQLGNLSKGQGIAQSMSDFLSSGGNTGYTVDRLLGSTNLGMPTTANSGRGLGNLLSWWNTNLQNQNATWDNPAKEGWLQQAGNVLQYLAPLALGTRTGDAVADQFRRSRNIFSEDTGNFGQSAYTPYAWLQDVFNQLNQTYRGYNTGRGLGAY